MLEWQTLVAVESLLRQAPMLRPAADFAQRTLALLPNRRFRLSVMAVLYLLVLLSGVLPLFLGLWAAGRFAPILTQPDLVQNIIRSLGRMVQLFGTVLDALLTGIGRFIIDQPALVGWLLVLAGLVFVWGSVYQRLVLSPQRA
jgi:hypothetical protein